MKMKTLFPVLGVLLALSLVPSHGFALSRRYDFGRLPFDAKVRSLPKWARPNSNCVQFDGKGMDCEFSDPDGISYVVFDDHVTAKKFSVLHGRAGGIPYGIAGNDGQDAVVNKLTKALGLNFRCDGYPDGDQDVRVTCESDPIEPEKYENLQIILQFGADGLIHAVVLSNADADT